MKFFIMHGTGGSPQGNWFEWLRIKLEEEGHIVFVPKFPTPENQSLDSWNKVFEKYIGEVDEETVLIGHSLAPAFILSIVEKLEIKIKGIILVAGFLGLLGNEFFDNCNRTFTTKEFDWEKIKSNVENIVVINSVDDPYVPFKRGEELANYLGVDIVKMEEAGHINSEFGFDKFEEILPFIERLENE